MERAPRTEREPDSTSLQEQFNRSEMFRFGKTEVEVFDVTPERVKSDVPVFFGPGYAAARRVYEGAILDIAESGRRVVSLFAPYGIETDPEFGKGEKTYPAAELCKAAAFLRTLDEKDPEQVDLVAHSESAIWMLIAASMRPDKVRNIVLANPAGLMEGDNFRRLGISFCLDIVQKMISTATYPEQYPQPKPSEHAWEDLLGGFKNILGKPIQSLKAALAMTDFDIRDLLEELKLQGKKIAVVYAVDDVIFPRETVVGTRQNPGTLHSKYVDGFYSVYGTHHELDANPEAYTRAVNHALDNLERLSQQEKGRE